MALRTILKQPEKKAQRDQGEKVWTCYYCGKEGHLKQDWHRASKSPWLHVRSASSHTGGETAPKGVGPRGQTLKTVRKKKRQSRLKVLWDPQTTSCPNYTWGTPGVNNCGDPIHWFPFGHLGNLLCACWIPWPTSPQFTSVMGLSVRAKRYYFSCPRSFNWDSAVFTLVLFSDHAGVSLTPFEEGYTEQGPCFCFHEYGALPFSTINWTKCKS